MSPNEFNPAEAVKHRPDAAAGKLHGPPRRAPHQAAQPPSHAAPKPEYRPLEVPLDQKGSLHAGLELLEKKVAEEAVETEARDPKLYERFRLVHDRHPEAFEAAFGSLQADRGRLSGTDFYDHLFRGLEVVGRNNPELAKLPPADRIAALLCGPGGSAEPSLEMIVRLFRAGEIAARSRALRLRAAPFADAYLALHWGRVTEEAAVNEAVAGREELNCFLTAAEVMIDLFDLLLERLEQVAQEESLRRAEAVKRLAEKKNAEKLHEKMGELARLEHLAEDRLGLGVKDAALVKLGRAVAAARAGLAEPLAEEVFLRAVVRGLNQFGTLEEFLQKALPLPADKIVPIIILACRWAQLPDHLAGLPPELADNIKTYLMGAGLSLVQKNEAFDLLADPQQRALMELGYQVMRDPPELLVSCFNLSGSPLQRLAAFGGYGEHFRQALAARDIPALVPALILCSDPDVRTEPEAAFSVHSQRLMIEHIFSEAPPAAIPVLIEAGDAALARLPRPDDRPLRTEIALFVARTVKALCTSQAAVAELVQDDPPVPPAEPGLVELFPVRRVTKQFVLSYLIATARQEPAGEPRAVRAERAWPNLFKTQVRQLAAENRRAVARPELQRQIVYLAARLATVKELIGRGELAEARQELGRALDEAAQHGLVIPQAVFFISSVYAGLMERAAAIRVDELPGLLGDRGAPELNLEGTSVPAVLAGEINIALKKTQGLADEFTAEDILLYGLIMRRVDYRQAAVAAVVALLKNRKIWDRLLAALRDQQLDETAGFIDDLLRTAQKLRAAVKVSAGALQLVQARPAYHPQVLHDALTEIMTDPPDIFSLAG